MHENNMINTNLRLRYNISYDCSLSDNSVRAIFKIIKKIINPKKNNREDILNNYNGNIKEFWNIRMSLTSHYDTICQISLFGKNLDQTNSDLNYGNSEIKLIQI
jgi:hypothetical protein